MIAPGSINGVLTGKHYNRCIRSHKLVYESMQQLRLKAFRDTLSNDESEKLDAIAISLLESVGKDIPDICCNNSEFIKWKEAYNSFVEKSCAENPTFAFWSTYIDMVQLLLTFIRATRTSDWKLHLSALRSMIPWFFATDRINYSRYAPCYWLEMSLLPKTHPCKLFALISSQYCNECCSFIIFSNFFHLDVAENIEENWTVQRHTNQGFFSVPCDQTIEQTFNKDSKIKGGLVGFTLNRGAVHRWILGQCERCAITRSCQDMADMQDKHRYVCFKRCNIN